MALVRGAGRLDEAKASYVNLDTVELMNVKQEDSLTLYIIPLSALPKLTAVIAISTIFVTEIYVDGNLSPQ